VGGSLKFDGASVRNVVPRPRETRQGRTGRFSSSTSFSGVIGQEVSGEIVIETRGLAKAFGDRQALRGVSFGANRGELLAVIGPNGAGKTTLLSILAGIRKPDSGSVSRPPGEIGWVPQQAALYRRLTVAENLRLFARLEKVPDLDVAVERMLAQTALTERRDDQAGTLSSGNQQRINIAIGLLARPAVLLLDEPSAGLDPRQRERLWDFVLALAGGGTTVIFSTHDLAEAERYGRRLLVLADGENLFDGSPPELHAAVPESGARDFEQAFVAFLRERGH
jgi:ABC-2 type transport system ATP-binding protein